MQLAWLTCTTLAASKKSWYLNLFGGCNTSKNSFGLLACLLPPTAAYQAPISVLLPALAAGHDPPLPNYN
jgi:hypothetical protein